MGFLQRAACHVYCSASIALLAVILLGGSPVQAATNPAALPHVEDARAFLDRGDLREAINSLKKALQEDDENVDARFLLGLVYLDAHDGASAEKELRTAYDQGLDNDLLRENLARQHKTAKIIADI